MDNFYKCSSERCKFKWGEISYSSGWPKISDYLSCWRASGESGNFIQCQEENWSNCFERNCQYLQKLKITDSLAILIWLINSSKAAFKLFWQQSTVNIYIFHIANQNIHMHTRIYNWNNFTIRYLTFYILVDRIFLYSVLFYSFLSHPFHASPLYFNPIHSTVVTSHSIDFMTLTGCIPQFENHPIKKSPHLLRIVQRCLLKHHLQ